MPPNSGSPVRRKRPHSGGGGGGGLASIGRTIQSAANSVSATAHHTPIHNVGQPTHNVGSSSGGSHHRGHHGRGHDTFEEHPPHQDPFDVLSAALNAGNYTAQTEGELPLYQDYQKNLFNAVVNQYPELGNMTPRSSVSYTGIPTAQGPSGSSSAGAWVDPYSPYTGADPNMVHYSPETVNDYFARPGTEQKQYADYVPLHEWAHLIQRRGLTHPQIEGGAEAYARGVAGDQGMAVPENDLYDPYVRAVRRRGRDFWTKNQFGR